MEQFNTKMHTLIAELAKAGARIDAFYCCPHHKADNYNCKKPKDGLAVKAGEAYALDLTQCYLVGDMGKTDMLLAHQIKAKAILVLTGAGTGSLGEYRSTWSGVEPAFVASDVLEASRWIEELEK